MICFTILTLPISGSKYNRSHFGVKKDQRLKYAWELLAVLSDTSWEQKHKEQIPRMKGTITIFWGRGQRMFDDDNLASGLKPLIDGMRDIGLIRNDSPRWFRLITDQKRDPERPRVEIELEAL